MMNQEDALFASSDFFCFGVQRANLAAICSRLWLNRLQYNESSPICLTGSYTYGRINKSRQEQIGKGY